MWRLFLAQPDALFFSAPHQSLTVIFLKSFLSLDIDQIKGKSTALTTVLDGFLYN